jgi:hypothetical protein
MPIVAIEVTFIDKPFTESHYQRALSEDLEKFLLCPALLELPVGSRPPVQTNVSSRSWKDRLAWWQAAYPLQKGEGNIELAGFAHDGGLYAIVVRPFCNALWLVPRFRRIGQLLLRRGNRIWHLTADSYLTIK